MNEVSLPFAVVVEALYCEQVRAGEREGERERVRERSNGVKHNVTVTSRKRVKNTLLKQQQQQ